jgi:hypothetical protein
VTQLVTRVLELLDAPAACQALSHRISERARRTFSGDAFASTFWEAVTERARGSDNRAMRDAGAAELARALRSCTLHPDMWPRVFEGPAQPVPLLDTGTSKIFELGGAVVQIAGDAPATAAAWSAFAPWFHDAAPRTTFADSLADLEPYLPGAGRRGARTGRLKSWTSDALAPFPKAHGLASQGYRWIRGAASVARRWTRFGRGAAAEARPARSAGRPNGIHR